MQRLGLSTPSLKRRVVHVLSVAVATALLTFPMHVTRLSDRRLINELFRDTTLNHEAFTQIFDSSHRTLFFYTCIKFFVSVLPCGSPLSIGVFGPLFTIGAAVGRLYGETLVRLWNPTQSPAAYAVIGAAVFASSATQTISTPVIFFELTGQMSHMLPMMVACVSGYFVSGMIAPSIYDILAEWAGLHSVCFDFNEYIMNQKTAELNMVPCPVLFTRETTYADALQVLNDHTREEYFPIVDDKENRILTVRRYVLCCVCLCSLCASRLWFFVPQGCIRRFDLEVGIARHFLVHKEVRTTPHASPVAHGLSL